MATTSINSTTNSTQFLAADTSRSGVIIENTDANRLYVLADDGTASATNFTFSLAQNENAYLPREFAIARIAGVWAGDGSGAAMVTAR